MSRITVASARLNAELIAAAGNANASTLEQSIAQWQACGYVREDASVLALVAPPPMAPMNASGSMQTIVLDSQSPLLQAGAFPHVIDRHCGKRNREPFAPMANPRPGIYPIVDNLVHLEMLMAAGAAIIQLRIKSEACTPEIERTIHDAVAMQQRYRQCQLFINDYWQAALDAGAYGVHLGQEDLLTADLHALQQAGIRLGVSSHAFWEVARALRIAPSYVACGPLFPTRAKKMPWISQGVENLRYWVRLIPYPVVGIGGVNEANLSAIHGTGCASASVIAAIVAADDPAGAFQELQSAWKACEAAKPEGEILSNQASIRLAAPTLSD